MRTLPGPARVPALLLGLAVLVAGCEPASSDPAPANAEAVPGAAAVPAVTAADDVEAGRYVIEIAGCNDCHTEGYLFDPTAPESEWLKGSVMGFRGPWGTSYPKNLRLTAANLTEDQWVDRLSGQGLPPMPWASVNHMGEADRRAIYRYIRSLGEPGPAAPAPLAPEVEPTTPWLDFTPRNLPGAAPAAG